MCELYGVSSRYKREYNEDLKKFFEHSVDHPHGWGIAELDHGDVRVEKEPVQATKSSYLKQRLRMPVAGNAVLAHIRYATIGNLEYANCHPFTGRDISGRQWTLIHNGTIFEYEPLNAFIKIQKGDTDSERIFLYLIFQMNDRIRELHRDLTPEERFEVLNKLVQNLSPENKLNLLIYDGEILYVHTNARGTLHISEGKDYVRFATRPIDHEEWGPVPMTQLLAFRDGKNILRGTVHGHEFHDDPEKMKLIYQAYSSL